MWISESSRELRVKELRAREKTSALFPTPVTRYLTPWLLFFTYFLLPTSQSLYAVSGLYEVRELKPGVFLWAPEDVLDVEGDPQYGRAANAGFVVTTEGVMVINTANSPFHGREILYEIRKRTEQPVRYVVNTDAHGDVMLGNEVFVSFPMVGKATFKDEAIKVVKNDERVITKSITFLCSV